MNSNSSETKTLDNASNSTQLNSSPYPSDIEKHLINHKYRQKRREFVKTNNYQDRLDRQNDDTSSSVRNETEQFVFHKILLWAPNLVADFVDIFRADIGVGPAIGGVLRISRYGQIGAREISYASYRVGSRGSKEFPFFIERDDEHGIAENFIQSSDRFVTPYELGIGLDLIIGGYLGVSFDEAIDFLAGIFFIDPKNDNL